MEKIVILADTLAEMAKNLQQRLKKFKVSNK